MPKAARLNARLADVLETDPLIPQAEVKLTLEERAELRAFLTGTLFKKALANARLCRPACIAGGLETANAGLLAINRLAEIRGWTLCEVALARQVMDAPIARKQPVDNYPDKGL